MRLNKRVFLLIFFYSLVNTFLCTAWAQSLPAWYLVSFKNKNNSPYSLQQASEYLSQKAILRREKAKIEIDSSDMPVNPNYIDSIISYGLKPSFYSKWLNATLVTVENPQQLAHLQQSSLIDSLAYVAPFLAPTIVSKHKNKIRHKLFTKSFNPDLQSIAQFTNTKSRIEMIALDKLMAQAYIGKSVQIAVFDNGFYHVNQLKAFAHLFSQSQILGAKDFTSAGTRVYEAGNHGTAVLSVMAAYINQSYVGSAIGAQYYLYKTEDDRFEFPVEECYWLFAAEQADSSGVDIITSSLGYTEFDQIALNHKPTQLNGKSSIISRAARWAAQKGILVVVSAGNDGNHHWQKISFPADAEGIITVGGVNNKGERAAFSSMGNSADGRIKPEVMTLGQNTAIVGEQGTIIYANGTSYSAPFMAGAAASLMQAKPQATAHEIREAIIQSSSRFMTPDSLMGYGIPNLFKAMSLLK
jgi:subtilisin family serine protease